jgi:ABC-type branched-subunit amino acid transport system ATPase component
MPDNIRVALDKVNVVFGGFKALDNLQMGLRSGHVTGLVGPNGAGKTTIINAVCGLRPPDSGQIYFDNHRIDSRPAWAVARMGLIRTFQELRLYDRLTVRQNVEAVSERKHARRKDRKRAVDALLEKFQLEDVADRPSAEISYAEAKRLSLARALAAEPQVLFLDEPASGLDEDALTNLIVLLRELRDQDLTVVIVEHNLEVIRRTADIVMFLANGSLVAEGSPDEIFSRDELSDIYFGKRR